MAICPVCSIVIEAGEAERRGLLLRHDGMVYKFCSSFCQNLFVQHSEHYHSAAHAHAGVSLPLSPSPSNAP